MERLDALQESFGQVVADEMSMAKLLESRINYLKEARSTSLSVWTIHQMEHSSLTTGGDLFCSEPAR